MAEPISPYGQSSSYSLTTLSLSSYSSTDRRAETDRMVGDADAGMRTILDAVWGEGGAVCLGPRPAS